jgi:hypothetical protein
MSSQVVENVLEPEVTLRIIKNKKNLEVSPKYERLPIEKRN